MRERWADVAPADQVRDQLIDPDLWRQRLLTVLLRMVGVMGALVAIPSIALAWAEGLYVVIVIDAVALATVALLIWVPALSHRSRSLGLLALAYGVGIFLFVAVGPVAGMYLMAVPVLAAVLLGTRTAVLGLVVIAATLLALGAAPGMDATLADMSTGDFAGWLLVTVNFMFVAGVITLSCAVLISRLEGSLEQSRRLAIAIEQSDNGIVLAELDGRVLYANVAARALDLPSDPDLRRMLAGAVPPLPDDLDGAWSGTVAVAGGRRRVVDVSSRPVDDRGVRRLVAVLRDVTAERDLAEQVRRTEKLQALGTLVGGTAHDFNNALASVIGLTEMLGEQLDEPAHRELVDQILLASDRARDVVRGLMAFTRHDRAERHPAAVATVLRDGLSLWRASVPARLGVELHVAPAAESARVVLDPPELHHVVANLVVNAAHAMRERPGGEIRITLERVAAPDPALAVQPALRAAPGVVALTVADDGEGIAPDVLSNVFDPFFTTKGLEGTGLGLASVHGTVSSLGGDIAIDSTPGAGTEVCILLPMAAVVAGEAAAAPTGPTAGTLGADPAVEREVHAVVVDDEAGVLDLVRRQLERRGVTVVPFEVAAEAVGHVADPAHRVDVVLTDLTMPAMTGVDLIRAIRTRRPELPVIVMSGYGAGLRDEDRSSLAVSEVLDKPFTGEALWQAVARALAPSTARPAGA